jgi:hypothetical protein
MKYFDRLFEGDIMSNYYFVTYINRRLGKQFFDSIAIDEHPFEWFKRSQRESNSKKVLVSWKEISEEEYRAFDEVADIKI